MATYEIVVTRGATYKIEASSEEEAFERLADAIPEYEETLTAEVWTVTSDLTDIFATYGG